MPDQSDWDSVFDDVFDIGADKEAYIFVKWFIGLFQGRIMKWLVAYIKSPKRDVKWIWNRANTTIGNLAAWKALSLTFATGGGASFGWFPLLFLPADVYALIDAMFKSSIGIGAILAKENGYELDVISAEDFLDIVAVWADVPEFVDDAKAKEEILSGFVSGRLIGKVGAKASMKVAIKTTAKVLVKFSAKLGSELAKLAPGAGVAANTWINVTYMSGVIEAAEKYYTDKFVGTVES